MKTFILENIYMSDMSAPSVCSTDRFPTFESALEDAFKKLVKRDSKGRIGYSYSDGFDGFRYGQELLCFCDIETAAQRLSI